jgi:hypothetical protein
VVVAEQTGRAAAARCNGGDGVRVGLRLRCAVRFGDGSVAPVEVRIIDRRGAFDVVAGLPGQTPVAEQDAPDPPRRFATDPVTGAPTGTTPGGGVPPVGGTTPAPGPPAAGSVTTAP